MRKPILTPKQICKIFGCTTYQLKEQYKANTEVLQEIRQHAKEEGRAVRGYTVAHLNTRIRVFKKIVKGLK